MAVRSRARPTPSSEIWSCMGLAFNTVPLSRPLPPTPFHSQVGTLDELVSLCDDLAKIDSFVYS